MKKVYLLIIILMIFSQLFSKNYFTLESSLLYFSYSGNDYMKNGLYESIKFTHSNLKSYSEYFQGYQRTYSDNFIFEQFEFKRSYAHFVKTNLKIGFDLKYTKVANGDFEQAILGGITGNVYAGNLTFTFSPALNYSFDGTENKVYQLSGKINYKYKDLSLNGSTYLFKVKNSEISKEKMRYLHEGSINYYGDLLGIYGIFSFGEKYLLTTFDNTYLNVSEDEFLHSFHFGILHYPILRNWSINYEFRKSIYNNLSKKEYTINAHLLNIYFSW
ncbi:MAG: hypothetical protein K8S23_07060 [Candidatus Cloacimonetes bacterium]|nr:hypothetical protein [Candidatus Cloacimonadota bacterium]